MPGQPHERSAARASGATGVPPSARSRRTRRSRGRLPEGREADRDPGDAVEEVAAETPFPGEPGEVAVRGGDEAEVDRPGPRLAQPPHLALLQDAQELRLDLRREVADLVEEEGPAGRRPRRLPPGPGLRP